MTNIRAINGAIQVRKVGEGKVRIAGYANRFGKVDTYGTRFDPKSVRLERFQSNPVLLFNHDVNLPVGKVVKTEPREDGVWVEAELSASSAPQVAYVRDLVEEGCLKAFSMRFGEDAVMEKDPEHPGAMIVRNWEMQEVSIVSLPAQSESLFSLRMAQRAFRNVHNKEEAKAVLETIRGAKAAAYVNECLTKAASEVERDDIMERLRDRSGMEAGELAKAMDGDVTPLPDAFVSAAVEVLGCDKDRLAELNAEDVEASKEGGESPADVEPAPVRAEDAAQECVAAKIPALMKEGMEQEQAVAKAIAMCSEERGCVGWRPTNEQMERFLRQAESAREEVSTPVESEMPNDNAMFQKLDSMVSLLGALVTEIKAMREDLNKLSMPAKVEEREVENETSADKEEEKPEEEPEGEMGDMERKIQATWERVEARAKALGL